ncbi:nuclear transport factor 2 family protein [Mangrovibacterium lignilyticum]|uniref:nuclear transport factor 2 family protein n=1 Tax=Mangrovibacterium lignilyticum TaxID=2668052 RepID=UPI0013D618C9|nr:nuclear transport factor 2 family protein [Mangrovibacterium lignilyticum]
MKPNQTNLKEIASDFLTHVATGKVEEAFVNWVANDFKHHNPWFKGDAQSLKQAMIENAAASPEKSLQIKQTIAEEKSVMTFSHICQHPTDKGYASVHIFLFDDNQKITELWDVGMQIPDVIANEHGLF